MEVDPSAPMSPEDYEAVHLAAIGDMMASTGPLNLDPAQYDYPNVLTNDLEDGEVDEQMEGTEHKRTKRGKRAGRKIQSIRKRDEEREERRQRRQGRR